MSVTFLRNAGRWRAIIRTMHSTFTGEWKRTPHTALRASIALMGAT